MIDFKLQKGDKPRDAGMQYLRLVFDNIHDAHTEWCNKPADFKCNDECNDKKHCEYCVRKECK